MHYKVYIIKLLSTFKYYEVEIVYENLSENTGSVDETNAEIIKLKRKMYLIVNVIPNSSIEQFLRNYREPKEWVGVGGFVRFPRLFWRLVFPKTR